MWDPRDFSYRKLHRKAINDGYITSLKASLELVVRRLVAPPVFNKLIADGRFHTISTDELFRISDIVHNKKKNAKKRENSGRFNFVAEVDGGYVLPTTGLVLNRDGVPIDESVGPPDDGNNGVIKSLVRHAFVDGVDVVSDVVTEDVDSLKRRSNTLETVCPLSYRYKNYYHWTTETLPRIRYARTYEERTGNEVTYLIWGDAPPYVNETLDLIGISDEKVEPATATVYRGSNVMVPSFPQKTAADFRWIRNSVLESVDAKSMSIDVGSNVFVSRADAIERRIVNDSEVMDILSGYGFEPYRLEEQSVAENVALFREADAVVGAHGAGLTDLIYCDDTMIIELFGSKVKDPYERLADTVGVGYHPMQCQPKSTDIRINVDHLQRTLENVLGQ